MKFHQLLPLTNGIDKWYHFPAIIIGNSSMARISQSEIRI